MNLFIKGLELIKAAECEWRDASGFGGTGSPSECLGEEETSGSRQTKCNEPDEPQKITCQRNYICRIRRGNIHIIYTLQDYSSPDWYQIKIRDFQVHQVSSVNEVSVSSKTKYISKLTFLSKVTPITTSVFLKWKSVPTSMFSTFILNSHSKHKKRKKTIFYKTSIFTRSDQVRSTLIQADIDYII